jgi:hypothetical protein
VLKPVVSKWNPKGDGLNCSACVARYLYWKLFGYELTDQVSAELDAFAQPRDLEQPFNRRVQILMSFSRTEALIQQVGLKLVERTPTGFSRPHPAGHYAVMSVNGPGGHVVYGHAPADNAGLELFDPQANERISWGHLSASVVATRFTKA